MTIQPLDRVLVTGAASGLGLALARRLSARGCRILGTDVHDESPSVLTDLRGVTYRRLDVREQDDWDAARDWVEQEWGGIDYVLNNAGVAAGSRLEWTEMDDWQWIIDINLLGVVRGCRTFVPMLKSAGSGHLVNTASAAGLVHPPRMSEYNTVKAGVVALSETLSYELGPYGVKVSVICPTFFKTNLSSSLRSKDPTTLESGGRLIDESKVTADEIAAQVVKGIDAERHIILTDRNGRVAYALKRYLRPVYDRVMAKAAQRMAAEDAAAAKEPQA